MTNRDQKKVWREKRKMLEKEKNKESIRVGVFVCHCGTNIGGVIDCSALAEYARMLTNVAFSEDNQYTCAETGLTSIKTAIKEKNLNRIVVASCTPRTHEPLFRKCVSDAGINPYLFNFVNIREQCSWVHMDYPDAAFEKAKDLIRMGVAKSIMLQPLEMIKIGVTQEAVVIGGGISGMNTALSLSRQGFKTHLVEKEYILGGRLNSLYKLFPHDTEASELIEDVKTKINNSKNLKVYTEAVVKSVDGYIGNYNIKILQLDRIIDLKVGTIIVAVGASLLIPENLYGYDGKSRITQHELESKLKAEEKISDKIVMIQCAGSRIKERIYCSNVCCMTALKNALIIKDRKPDSNITILFRDIYAPGTYEDYYRRARESGVLFIKYTEDKLPIVEETQVKVFNEYIGEKMILPYNLLVLSTPLIANYDNKELSQMLKVPLEPNNFFLEAHVKLRPVDFATEGIFVCGSAKWPVDVSESIVQGLAAASRASTIISNKNLNFSGSIAEVEESKCNGCGDCRDACVYNAVEMVETRIEFKAIRDSFIPSTALIKHKSKVIPSMCKGCGVCVGICPVGALSLKNFTNEQIGVEIESYLS
ncbi:MAG: CoB--CoM heterodisulfide reductase iron-sulfur subunit A family protein [Candidatus Lokiarchaeota archaeon]|nr:CoB--CoM heterodisulfide reductase iron-sulfur subunit A family protein [Candidatus Lokiarchaeota archaeon]